MVISENVNGENVNGERVNSESRGNSLMVRKVFLFIYVVGMLILVVLPLNDTKASFLSDTYVVKLRLDYLVHVIVFLPFILLVKLSYSMDLLKGLLLGLVFAGICEGIQYLLPYRSFNVNDLIANVIGIIVGIVLVWRPVYGRSFTNVNSENVKR